MGIRTRADTSTDLTSEIRRSTDTVTSFGYVICDLAVTPALCYDDDYDNEEPQAGVCPQSLRYVLTSLCINY